MWAAGADLPLADTGLMVEEFPTHWRNGVPGLDAVARVYGRMLHRKLWQEPAE